MPKTQALSPELEKFLFNVDAEICTIGSMLLNKEVCSEVLSSVSEEDFYDDFNGNVFRVIKELFTEGRSVDAITISSELRPVYPDQDVSLKLAEYEARTPNPMSAGYYSQIVKDRSMLRKLVLSCQSIITEVSRSRGADPLELLNYAQREILRITELKQTSPARSMVDLLQEAFPKMLDLQKMRDREYRIVGIPTGFYEVDDLTGGLQAGSMYVVAGRPGMGKTSLALRIALSVSQYSESRESQESVPVYFVSLEMSAENIVQQMLCIQGKLNAHKLRKGMFSDEEYGTLSLLAGKLKDYKIWIEDSSDVSIYDLRVKCRRWMSRMKDTLKDRMKTAVIIVDYLQLLTAASAYRAAESRYVEITTISQNLKAIAKEMNVPVIAVAQLNRAPDKRENNKPMLSDLKESGSIEQDADVVMLLCREEYYKKDTENKNMCRLEIAKNRLGPVGEVELVFLKEYTRFENLARAV